MGKNILMILAVLLVISCDKDDDNIPEIEQEAISFNGVWSREFEAGEGNFHVAAYLVYQDSIRYTLAGSLGNANYVINRDTFLLENNRYIGHSITNQHYLIFVKNANQDSITLYKQEVIDMAEGLIIDVPADDTVANHGWNTYYKQYP